LKPLDLIQYGGLNEFWELFSLALQISPYESVHDGNKIIHLPTITMIAEIGHDFEIHMDAKSFWNCAAQSIQTVRQSIRTSIKTLGT
jgi:hypothetical protein